MTLLPTDVSALELTRIFRHPTCYAPATVRTVLADVVAAPELALLVDVDALETSALARVDRVMQLALCALANADVDVYFAAVRERSRARALQRILPTSRVFASGAIIPMLDVVAQTSQSAIVLSDAPDVFASLAPTHRGLALGRPELASHQIAVLADASVRATLWWLCDARVRALSS